MNDSFETTVKSALRKLNAEPSVTIDIQRCT